MILENVQIQHHSSFTFRVMLGLQSRGSRGAFNCDRNHLRHGISIKSPRKFVPAKGRKLVRFGDLSTPRIHELGYRRPTSRLDNFSGHSCPITTKCLISKKAEIFAEKDNRSRFEVRSGNRCQIRKRTSILKKDVRSEIRVGLPMLNLKGGLN